MNIYYSLPSKTNEEIVNDMIEKLLIISNNYKIITMYGFDEDSQDTWMAMGSGLECLARSFNDSYITTDIAKINPYIINIKIVLQTCNKLHMETKNQYSMRTNHVSSLAYDGEVWTLYVQSLNELENIFQMLGKSKNFSDNNIHNNALDSDIVPIY